MFHPAGDEISQAAKGVESRQDHLQILSTATTSGVEEDHLGARRADLVPALCVE